MFIRIVIDLIPKYIRHSIDPEVVITQVTLEKSRNSEKDKLFMLYAKEWWSDYLKIRSEKS